MPDFESKWYFDAVHDDDDELERVDIYHRTDKDAPAMVVPGAEWRSLRDAFLKVEAEDWPYRPNAEQWVTE